MSTTITEKSLLLETEAVIDRAMAAQRAMTDTEREEVRGRLDRVDALRKSRVAEAEDQQLRKSLASALRGTPQPGEPQGPPQARRRSLQRRPGWRRRSGRHGSRAPVSSRSASWRSSHRG